MRTSAKTRHVSPLAIRDEMWAAIRRFGVGAPFSMAEIEVLSKQHPSTVRTYVLILAKAGILQDAGELRPARKPVVELAQFRLVRDLGAVAPRMNVAGEETHNGRQRMWNYMRHNAGDFSAHDVAFNSTTSGREVVVEDARHYVSMLARAGCVRKVKNSVPGRPAKPGAGMARFVFVRTFNTGPRSPAITRTGQVFDGNNGQQLYGPKEVSRDR